MFTLRNDKYRKARGGKAFVVELGCSGCGAYLLTYQKDGDGQLKRCYLNRILAPDTLASLSHNPEIKESGDLPHLNCSKCGTVIAAPIRHHDGRLAFRLRQGFFTKRRLTA